MLIATWAERASRWCWRGGAWDNGDSAQISFEEYAYDALGRVTSKLSPDYASLRDVYYSYDLFGDLTSARYDSASGADAVVADYDALGRATFSRTNMAGTSRTLSYGYNADGSRASLTHPDGTWFEVTHQTGGAEVGAIVHELGGAVVPIFGLVFDDLGRRTMTQHTGSNTDHDAARRDAARPDRAGAVTRRCATA